jgi:geranylgeranyl diphosphate synthase type II
VAWLLLPLLLGGEDETMDPARFVLLPITRRRLAVGLTTSSMIGAAPLATAVVALAAVVTWTRGPGSLVTAVVALPLAVLTGDALIVMAFQTLSKSVAGAPERLVPLVEIYSEAVGAPNGICAGQAWESEPQIDLVEYQRAKTGALFAAATEAGAAAAGYDYPAWRVLGEALGEAYQIADDLRDVAADPEQLGKPVGQDAILGRPNAVQALGLKGAVGRLKRLVAAAVESIPDCPGRDPLQAAILEETGRFLPAELARQAA